MKKTKNNQKAFTLIEVMIVIAVIGILAAIAIPNFLSYKIKGYNAAASSEAKNFYVIALSYAKDKGHSSAVTLSSSNLPTGFSENADIITTGSFIVGTDGNSTSSMTFQHSKSNTTFSLDENGGITHN